jgi:hypothetical protein
MTSLYFEHHKNTDRLKHIKIRNLPKSFEITKVSEVVLAMCVKGVRLCENMAVEKTPTGRDLSGYI